MSTEQTTEIVDAVPVENGQELVQHDAPSPTLFRTDDPAVVLEKASRVADALKDVLHRQNLTANIRGKDHVLVEGWTTLGSMLGVVPVVEWTRPLPEGAGWEARVEAKTLDGRVVGAAEAECTRQEGRWKSADDYAVRSMAQTRATSKALRGPLGFIVTLAGYSATPAEEMPANGTEHGPGVTTNENVDEHLLETVRGEIRDRIKERRLPWKQIKQHLVACGVDDIWDPSGATVGDKATRAIDALDEQRATSLLELLTDGS